GPLARESSNNWRYQAFALRTRCERNGDVSPTTLSTYHKLHGGSLTCTHIPPNIPRLHDWPSHLSLPHRRKAGWRRDGRCLQGRRHLPGTVCRSEVSSLRGLPRCC